jgi:nicotinamidase-related amidase
VVLGGDRPRWLKKFTETPQSKSGYFDFNSLIDNKPINEWRNEMGANIPANTDGGLLTPQNCAVVFIDHQPQMTFGVANMDRQLLMNNVVLLAKCAKLFGIPAILTAVETESFSGYIWPQLLDVFPGQEVIERTSMNSWDDAAFRKAVEATGKKNVVMAGLWTEVCVTWPALNMLDKGYNVFVVEDACGATSQAAQDASLSRMAQAGVVRMTTVPTVLEFQRDWARREHYDALMEILKEHTGAYGAGIEYAYTMLHHAPQSAKKPQVVPKKSH